VRLQQTFARHDYIRYADDALRRAPLLDPIAIEFGELYRPASSKAATPTLLSRGIPKNGEGNPERARRTVS